MSGPAKETAKMVMSLSTLDKSADDRSELPDVRQRQEDQGKRIPSPGAYP
jgi:hypothetical protein